MVPQIVISLLAVVATGLVALIVWRGWVIRQERRRCVLRRLFHRRREWLEAEFLKTASQSGKPRGLAWADCEFDDEVQFAKDRSSGKLCALVAVTIGFEAIAGEGMEDVEAVDDPKGATALFVFDGKKWTTYGRALFNLVPSEAIMRLGHELERVD